MTNTFKSIRLSQAIRNNISDSMMESWIKNNKSPHDPEEFEKSVGDTIWLNKFHAIKTHLNKIPAEMLKLSPSVKVSVSGQFVAFKMSIARPHPYSDMWSTTPIEILDEPTLDMHALEHARMNMTDWLKQKEEFKSEINLILDSVSTTGQLIQMWPESEQYLPAFAADPSKGINLPALKTSRLNSLLGIK